MDKSFYIFLEVSYYIEVGCKYRSEKIKYCIYLVSKPKFLEKCRYLKTTENLNRPKPTKGNELVV